MPPRHAYWTIIFGNQPTAFRTHTQEELLPTFRQIQAKHPDAVMMWFAHGRLWKSPEDAREARFRRQQERRPPRPQWRDRPPRDDRHPAPPHGAPKPRHEGRGPRPQWGGKPDWKNRPPRETRAPSPQAKDRWRNRPDTGSRPPETAGGKPSTDTRERPRGRDWRPGGEHKDPRDRFKVPRDVKRARFKAKAWRDRTNPGPPKYRQGGPVPPKPRSGEGGRKRKKEDEE